MGVGVFNVARGREIELHDRVNDNDPAASELVGMLCTGVVTDAVLEDFDTFAAILAGTLAETTAGGYARMILNDSDIGASTVDDTNNRREADIPDYTFTSLTGTHNLTRFIIGYDPLGTGVDANIIPIAYYDYVSTTDGTDRVVRFNAAGYIRAA